MKGRSKIGGRGGIPLPPPRGYGPDYICYPFCSVPSPVYGDHASVLSDISRVFAKLSLRRRTTERAVMATKYSEKWRAA